ncbi:hypothetical protein PUN28_013927 [Cardiocondyla obscurior]|uniref:Uncharacterized protein n=1 Tax=Cardiocondyla obscurior TaxID=286306 RepID=A0AAW2F709_9HYME
MLRAFNLRCIGQSYQMVSFKELEFFMESMLIVALSKVPADLRMSYLDNVIKGNSNINNKIETILIAVDEEEKIDDNDDKENPETEFNIHETNCDITNWVK